MSEPDNHVDDKLEEILVNLIEAGFKDAFRIVAEKKKPSRDGVVRFLRENVGTARQLLDQYYADFYRNKIPEKKPMGDYITNPRHKGWNDCVDDITAQFNSKEDSNHGE